VRIGDTVRRPVSPASPFVHELLLHLERVGFTGAPRFLGIDERGREILSFIDGTVPPDLDPELSDEQLTAAAHLLRRYHDATAGSALAGPEEVVCHNDISPVNAVFVEGMPQALIDFDFARAGPRIRDVSYGLFLWLNLGWDGPDPEVQRHRMRIWCESYELEDTSRLLTEVETRIEETVRRRRRDGDEDAAAWWHHQLGWIRRHEETLSLS